MKALGSVVKYTYGNLLEVAQMRNSEDLLFEGSLLKKINIKHYKCVLIVGKFNIVRITFSHEIENKKR